MTAALPINDEIPSAVRAWFAEVGRRGAAQRAIVTGSCGVCGAAMRGLKTKRYCTDACRQTARRQRTRNLSR